MNCIKLLSELMMKNGLKIKLHRKHFIALVLLSSLGISTTSQATECFEKFRKMCVEKNGKHSDMQFNCNDSELQLSNKLFEHYDERKGEWTLTDLDNYISDEQRIIKIAKSNGRGYSQEEFSICRYQEQKKYYQTGKRPSSNASSNQSSSSGSSSQSNKRTNRQSANNQSSSNSSDKSMKRLNEAIDQSNNAHDNKDYAKSIAAIKIILAESKDMPLKAAASNRLGEYYKDGKGVQKDEIKAQALFEQASLAGDPDADAHIGENYQDGTGGVIKNHQTAIKYFTAAAAKGHVVAMSKLGYLYHAGIGTINPELGNEWICKAAKQGDSTAIGNADKLKLNCN